MRLNGVFNRAKCYFLNTSKRYNEYLSHDAMLTFLLGINK